MESLYCIYDIGLYYPSTIRAVYLYFYFRTSIVNPTDGVSTLSWWWGLSTPETLRAMPAVA
jgi:hypothetical protein